MKIIYITFVLCIRRNIIQGNSFWDEAGVSAPQMSINDSSEDLGYNVMLNHFSD